MISAQILICILFGCFIASFILGIVLVKTKFKNSKFETQLKAFLSAPIICMFCLIFVGICWSAVPCEVVIEEKSCDSFALNENAVQLQWRDGVLTGAQIYKNINDVVVIANFSFVKIVNNIDEATHLRVHNVECAQTIFGLFDCYHYNKIWAELI